MQGTDGIIKAWDEVSGHLLAKLNVGCAVLRIVWISHSRFKEAFVVGLEDGSVALYWRKAQSWIAGFSVRYVPLLSLQVGLHPLIICYLTSEISSLRELLYHSSNALSKLSSRGLLKISTSLMTCLLLLGVAI